MQTYRDEIDTDVEGRPAHAARVLENKPSQQGGDLGLTSVNAFYDLGLEMAIGDQREGTKSIKQEYTSYITQELSKAGSDILKYWEVCGVNNICDNRRRVFPGQW